MGVKSLWSLLSPVGRPIMLEAMEGKSLAIDSSIWIYQFQATMRDKDGHALINAHVLGFLRRISKLLFYGIKPVFVFDGGAPTLKRSTLNERKKKKAGAAASHARIAEKLLAAQMRREALKHAGAQASTKGKGKKSSAGLDDDTVYLEDIDGSVPKTPSRRIAPTPSSSSTKKKDRAHEFDRYYLPDVDLEEAVAKATRTAVPDPRLATEDELRAFIEDMRPEDFDVNSPAFRELPTEVQYEIVGDLRLKSRQTSYARLQKMLRSAPTPLDFSKQQIKNLRQRNALTQQLLMTTDSIGSAHISIPVRIASERNKEYVLIKNEGHSGGWILGIRDSGTREKPIEIDHEDDKGNDKDDDSDAEMEEVEIPAPSHADPDLRSYQREMALSGLANRQTSTGLAPLSKKSSMNRKTKSIPLFEPEEDELQPHSPLSEIDEDNEELAFAIQASMDERSTTVQPSKMAPISDSREVSPDDDIYASPRRLDTVLSIANAGPSRIQASPSHKRKSVPTTFGKPILLAPTSALNIPDSDDDWEEVVPQHKVAATLVRSSTVEIESISASNDFDMAAVEVSESTTLQKLAMAMSEEKIDSGEEVDADGVSLPPMRSPEHVNELPKTPAIVTDSVIDTDTVRTFTVINQQLTKPHTPSPPPHYDGFEEAEAFFAPSRSPSPSEDIPEESKIESWDAAQEMDPHAEEGEFAKFMSQVKGKDLDDVRREIDVEIETLHQQRKAAMRDSEDITQQMITQIMTMLRLFGIPYITAPMEAEAQCAELVTLKLVDGIITDDSDVFLFGGQRVYKNMFNQSKTVEGFALADLTRDLGLDQDALIRLAYLLGSDYVEGLPGVGPVVAMELLQEFPGKDGLYKFKDWWTKVQAGKDKGEDNKSTFRKSFKKKFKDLYLPSDWPNSAVQDAYYHPIVDSSEEPFKWGLPDLDALRDFLNQELGWGKAKVDENLLPIIQKMNKRSQAMALNKQGNLNAFLDVAAGSGTRAPRQRQAYASKRLQKVITDFRKSQKAGSTASSEKSRSRSGSESEQDSGPEKKRRKTASAATSSAKGTARRSGKVAGQKRTGSSSKGKKRSKGKEDASSDEDTFVGSGGDPDVVDIEVPLAIKLRPRPKPRPIRKLAKTNEPSPEGSEGEV